MPKRSSKAKSGAEASENSDSAEVSDLLIDKWLNLHPIHLRLNKLFGKGEWTKESARDTVRQWILEKRLRDASPAPPRTANQKKYDADKRAREVQARLDVYLSKFTNVTPNDVVLFGELAEIEQQLAELSDEMQYADLAIDERLKQRERNNAFRLKLAGEHRKIQSDLGIGRTQREGEIESDQQFRRLAEGGKALLNRYAVMISCPHCTAPTHLNQGLILFHFREVVPWRWTSVCPNPKCRREIVIQGGPSKPIAIAKPPEYETPLLEAANETTLDQA